MSCCLHTTATSGERRDYYIMAAAMLTGGYIPSRLPALPPEPCGRIKRGIEYRAGVRFDPSDPSDFGLQWAIFKRRDISPEAALELLGWEEYYSGPGRSFAHKPVVVVAGSRILITQTGGYDC